MASSSCKTDYFLRRIDVLRSIRQDPSVERGSTQPNSLRRTRHDRRARSEFAVRWSPCMPAAPRTEMSEALPCNFQVAPRRGDPRNGPA